MFTRKTFNYAYRNLHNSAEYLTRHYLFWKSLVQNKLFQIAWGEPESIYKVQHLWLAAKILGVGWCVQHDAMAWWNSRPVKAVQHLQIWSVGQQWLSLASVTGWKCAVEKGTIWVGAEHRLYGKITEWESEQRQNWRLLSCCSRQEKEHVRRFSLLLR